MLKPKTMKKAYIVLILASVFSLSLTAFQSPKVTVVKRFDDDKETQNFILQQSSKGYTLKGLIAYNDGSPSLMSFMVVMEK
jgi:hypothetical protein